MNGKVFFAGVLILSMTAGSGAQSRGGLPQPPLPLPQSGSPPNRGSGPTAPGPLPSYPVEKIGENLFRLGSIRVDTAKREVTVPGVVNESRTLEFIASTKNGFKGYESALELDTNAVTFNIAMILIGMDKDHAVPPTRHFDPKIPEGDPLEIWVEWKIGAETRRIPVTDLLWDRAKKEKFPNAPWIYIGGDFSPDGKYMSETDGVLIGFVHDPASIIEWAGANGVGRFGFVEIDPSLKLPARMPVTVIIKSAVPTPPAPSATNSKQPAPPRGK